MILSSFLGALVVVISAIIPHASAMSAPPRPLTRVAHPSTVALEILPRRVNILDARAPPDSAPVLRHTDSFRLTLDAFGQTFHLHLAPNEHLLHPEAQVHYYRPGPDGRSERYASAPLAGVRAYVGEVVPAPASARRMREDAAGVVRDSASDWARVLVHDQGDVHAGRAPVFEGAFVVAGVTHHVATRANYLRNRQVLDPELAAYAGADGGLVIWRDSEVMSPEQHTAARRGLPLPPVSARAPTCAHDHELFNSDPLVNPVLKPRLPEDTEPAWYYDGFKLLDTYSNTSKKRSDVVSGGGNSMSSNFASSIGSTVGCPGEQKLVFTGVAADCEYTSHYGSVQNATNQILNDWNMASSLYKQTFNISLGIITMEMHDPTCPTNTDPNTPWNVNCNALTLNDRLSAFSQWRGKRGNDNAGLWHLLSGCPTGDEVGIAWLGTLCQQSTSQSGNATVSGTAVSTAGLTEWQVVAHETGHNFGAIHDCASGCTGQNDSPNCCPLSTSTCNANASFLMSPVANTYETKFSPCSIGNICSLMTGTMTGGGGFTNMTCLQTPGEANAPKLISLQQCGNGIVEAGEDCDPGAEGASACCDSNCKFRSGAVCDPASSPCCTPRCGFAPSSQTCRPSKDSSCDIAEMCTGNSSVCPADAFQPNGQGCGNGLACASGVCTSPSKQCQQQGTSLNLQSACPQANNNCQLSCQDPSNSRQCITMQTKLLDGSPCGYGGSCSSGSCRSGSLFATVKAWAIQNPYIAIPAGIGIGLVVLLVLYFLISAILRCCRRPKAPAVAAPMGQPYAFGLEAQTVQRTVLRAPTTRREGEPVPRPDSRPASNAAGPYQREVLSDGNWVSFGDASAGQGQAQAGRQPLGTGWRPLPHPTDGNNTYSRWSDASRG